MFSNTISAFTLLCLFAVASGKITRFKDFTFLSPNLKLVFDGKLSVSFNVCSGRLDLKFSNQIWPATVLVHAVSVTADLEASATKNLGLAISAWSCHQDYSNFFTIFVITVSLILVTSTTALSYLWGHWSILHIWITDKTMGYFINFIWWI